MAKKISEFNEATIPLSGLEKVPIVQNGNSVKTSINSLTKAVQDQIDTHAVNVKTRGAVCDGITDDRAAIQAVLDSETSILLPAWCKISAPLTLRDGHRIFGVSPLDSGLIKADFDGPALLGVDTDWVYLSNFGIDGPGQWVGTGNKGIDIHVSSQEILTNLTVRNVHLRYLNDISLYVGTGAFCTYDQVKIFQGGYAGIFIDGGDGHTFISSSVRDIILGVYLYGPTTVNINGTYIEQAGLGFWLDGANAVTLSGSGVEANINRSAEFPGRSYRISGGEGNSIISGMSRQDTIGAAAAPDAQHLLIDGNASRTTILSFRKINSETYPPTTEVDVAAALEPVLVGPHNFDPSKVVGGLKFGDIVSTSELSSSTTSNSTTTAANSAAVKAVQDAMDGLVVTNLTALRGITNGTVPSIYLENHTSAGDGGGGHFRWVSGASPGTYTDNNGTVIVPTGGDGSAAWLRDYTGAVNVKWFGAKYDGSDDSAAAQAAIDVQAALNGGSVFVPRGVTWWRDVELKSKVHLIGDGSASSKIRFKPSGDDAADALLYVIRWTGAYGSIHGLTVDGQAGGGLFSVGSGIYIAQGVDNTYSRTLSDTRVEFFAGHRSGAAGGVYGLREEFAADDIRDSGTGAHLLSGGHGVVVSNDEGYASNLVIEGLIVQRVDGSGLDLGKANDSKLSKIQIGGAMHWGLAARFANKNIQYSDIKVFLSRRLNISTTGSSVDIVPYFGTAANDFEGAVILTGANHQGTIEAQENGSHGFRLGNSSYGMYASTLDMTVDGNGGYVSGTPAVRYGVVLGNYYMLNLRVNGDDLRSKQGIGRQSRAIFASTPISYTNLTNIEVGGWYKILNNTDADFTPLQVGYVSTSNAVGTIFQAREATPGAGLSGSTVFGSGSLVSVHDGIIMMATIINQYEQDQGTGDGYLLTNDGGVYSTFIINGLVKSSNLGTAAYTPTTDYVSAFPLTSATPTVNGEMTFELTDNTTLTVKVKGSDGTVRSTTLTLV